MRQRVATTEPYSILSPLRPFARALIASGAKVPGLLEHVETMDVRQRYPTEVLRNLLEVAVQASGRPDLGLRAAQFCEPGDHDLIEYLAMSSPTVREAIESINQRLRLVSDYLRGDLEVHGDRALWRFSLVETPPRAIAEFGLAKIFSRAGKLLGEAGTVVVSFIHEQPDYVAEYRRVFGPCQVRFGAPYLGFEFDRSVIELSPATADPGLHRVLTDHADHVLASLPQVQSLADEVRRIVRVKLSSGALSAEDTAARLRMSRRNLTRRLREENTSFTEIVDQVRFEMARHYLANTSLSQHEVGLVLGFSGRKALARAFRRWTGLSISSFRRTAQAANHTEVATVGAPAAADREHHGTH
jgi:AraC-like DNA-binding protein